MVRTVALVVAGAAAGAILSARLGLVGPAVAQGGPLVTAREFHAVDARGTIRARLAVDPDDVGVVLELNDARGLPRFRVQEFHGAAFALFWDRNGGNSYQVGFDIPSITFLDAKDQIRVSLPTASWRGLPPLPQFPDPFGPTAAAAAGEGRSPQSVTAAEANALRAEIDKLNARVNDIAARINMQR